MKLIIVFGGKSYEHEISIVSAITLKEKLKERFDLSFVFCDENHNFYLIENEKLKAKYFSSYEYKNALKLELKQNGFISKKFLSKLELNGVVLNLVHGGDGEDGVLAGLFDFYNIPYIGPRIEASVFSFDKRYTKFYAQNRGVNVLRYEVLNRYDQKYVSFEYPFIIKPARLGSSIGVSVIKEESELDYALDVAYEFDENILIEPFIENVKEYNLAGCKVGDEYIFSIVEEPQKNEFLDFEKKYMDFSRDERVQKADISKDLETKLQNNFKKLYNGIFEGSLIRCDFFLINDEVYLNEINPIPGSMANYLFDDFGDVLEKLANSLPKKKDIKTRYEYIHSISKAKGK